MDRESLGFDGWFRERDESSPMPEAQACRVISVHKNSYFVSNGEVTVYAEATGNLLHRADSPFDLPVVGDWVQAQMLDDDTFSVIHSVFPRKTHLARKVAGKSADFQLIAANVDTALIVQGLDADLNLRRLERYLSMVADGGVAPVVLLSKSDLLSDDMVEERVRQAGAVAPDVDVIPFSNETGQGIDEVSSVFLPGRTYCLIGSSGVGKTTLLNRLLGERRYRTEEVRAGDGKGRHATTARQLTVLASGALMIDTPGMRELGMIAVGAGLEDAFAEIDAAANCRFSDCGHVSEDGCGVLAALADGKISRERYDAYMKLKRESEFHAMSYRKRRNKDREFGKMVKSVMKHRKKGV